MLILNDEQVNLLQSIFSAFDELTGAWAQMERALREAGFEDPEAAWDALREHVFNG